MGTASNPIYWSSLKRYRSGRTYRRLDGRLIVKKNVRILRLGGKTQRRPWKTVREIIPNDLQLKIKSPMKILAKLRDGYINMMLGVARNVGYLDDAKHVFGEKRIPRARTLPTVSKLNEFDKKLVLRIYNSIAASRDRICCCLLNSNLISGNFV